MSDLAAPHILALTAYEPGKPEEELKRELGIDVVVKLASNENPYGPSPKAVEALSRATGALHRYPDPQSHDLRQALASHHGVPADELCLGNGSNELIDLICRVVASRGEHAVFGHPSFPCYRIGSVAQELDFTAVPLRDDLALLLAPGFVHTTYGEETNRSDDGLASLEVDAVLDVDLFFADRDHCRLRLGGPPLPPAAAERVQCRAGGDEPSIHRRAIP